MYISDEDDDVGKPQVTSTDPEERKLARKLRIQRRIEAIKKLHEQTSKSKLPEKEKSLLHHQIEESASILDQLRLEGEEIISNVRCGVTAREIRRRERETENRLKIVSKLEEESKDAEIMYEEICSKWDTIAKYKDPLDISEGIAMQRKHCDVIVKQKDGIIQMLKEEINKAERKYVYDQDVQAQDINTLVNRIETQLFLMRKAYQNQLAQVEIVKDKERQILLHHKNLKWENLQDQRREDEDNYLKSKLDSTEEFMQTFYNTRVRHEEEYRQLKIDLDTQCELLEQELEQLKSTCIISGEKFDYNYNVLKKREDENLVIRTQQKRILNKYRDGIKQIRRSMKECKQQTVNTIEKIRVDINKIRSSIFEMEKKSAHICVLNNIKYLQIWELNEKLLEKELHRIVKADRVIYEQILGISWKSPIVDIVKKESLPSYREALDLMKPKRDYRKKIPKEVTANDFKVYTNRILKDILSKIAFRSGFILEPKLGFILPSVDETNKDLLRVDNVFNALGIQKDEEFKYLVDYFLPYAHCPICDDKSVMEVGKSVMLGAKSSSDFSTMQEYMDGYSLTTNEEEQPKCIEDVKKIVRDMPDIIKTLITKELAEPKILESSNSSRRSGSTPTVSSDEFLVTTVTRGPGQFKFTSKCRNNHPLRIERVNVYKIFKEFVSVLNYKPHEKRTLQKRVEKRPQSISRLLFENDVKMFWSQFYSCFSKQHEQIWEELLIALKKYYTILIERKNTYDQVLVLRRENQLLKRMLKQCTRKIITQKTRPCSAGRKIHKFRKSTPIRDYPKHTKIIVEEEAIKDFSIQTNEEDIMEHFFF